MKCPKCNGRGAVQIAPNVKGLKRCPVCDGSGEVSQILQTNEEWFCSLPTEEKAKFLFEHGVIVCNFCKGDCVEIDYKTSECKYNVSPSYSYTGIVKWLKQPHTKKE